MFTVKYDVFFGIGTDEGLKDVRPVVEWVGPAEAVAARHETENAYVNEHGGYFTRTHECDMDALWEHETAPGEKSGAQIYVRKDIDILN